MRVTDSNKSRIGALYTNPIVGYCDGCKNCNYLNAMDAIPYCYAYKVPCEIIKECFAFRRPVPMSYFK